MANVQVRPVILQGLCVTKHLSNMFCLVSSMWNFVILHFPETLSFEQVMVANVRCEEIMWDKLDTLFESEQWHLLSDRASSQLLPDFGSQAHFFLEACINGKHLSCPSNPKFLVQYKFVQWLFLGIALVFLFKYKFYCKFYSINIWIITLSEHFDHARRSTHVELKILANSHTLIAWILNMPCVPGMQACLWTWESLMFLLSHLTFVTFSAGYDGEARYFEEGVRSSKRAELKNRISGELKTAFDKQLKILHSEILQSAKKGIAEGEGSDNAFMEIARR